MAVKQNFWDALTEKGDRTAIVTNSGNKVTYADLTAMADNWSVKLADAIGPDRIGKLLIALEFHAELEFVAAYLGALRAGHAVILCDCKNAAPDSDLLRRFQPNIRIVKQAGEATVEVLNRSTIPMLPETTVLLSTSGTTGASKLVRLSATNLEANAQSIVEYLEITPEDRAASTLPLYYSYGMSVLNSYLCAGASIALTDLSVTENAFWTMCIERAVTSLALVPHQFDLLETVQFQTKSLPKLRYITQAGGKLAPTKIEKFAGFGREMGWQLFIMYGQTEASPRISYVPANDVHDHGDTIGKAIPGGKLWITDDDGQEVMEPDIAGELFYTGPNVMLGYAETQEQLNDPAAEPILATGDIASRTANGYFKIVGRKKRFVKLFGLRLGLDEIEQRLHDNGHNCYAVNSNDVLVVFCTERDTDALQSFIASSYSLPTDSIVVESLDKIPLMSSGKIDYRALEAKAASLVSVQAETDSSSGGEEISAVIRRATRSIDIKKGDTFSSLGGDSLAYLQVAMFLEKRLGFIPDGWENMSIETLSRLKSAAKKFGSIGTDVILRLVAVSLIVINHLSGGTVPAGGGTWLLLMLVGYSFAQFATDPIIKNRQMMSTFKLLYPILPLYYLILVVVVIAGRHVEPSMWTLTNNLGNDWSGFLVTPNWFVSLYVQLIVFLMILFSLAPIKKLLQKNPWQLGIALCLIGTAVAFVYAQVETAAIAPGTERKDIAYIVRSPLTCFPFALLGWTIYFAKGQIQAAVTAACVILGAVVFPGPDPYYSFTIAIGGLLLVSKFTFKVPLWSSALLRTAAAASLFVYMLHGLPVHVFRFATDWAQEWGILVSALIVVPATFLMAHIAKKAFEIFDVVVVSLVRRARSANS